MKTIEDVKKFIETRRKTYDILWEVSGPISNAIMDTHKKATLSTLDDLESFINTTISTEDWVKKDIEYAKKAADIGRGLMKLVNLEKSMVYKFIPKKDDLPC